MKYITITIFICAFASCNSPEKLICRTWKIDGISFEKSGTGIEQQLQEQIKKVAGGYSLAFKKDSVYVLLKKDGETKGKWWFTGDKKSFSSVTSEVSVDAKILTLSSKKLVFAAKDPSGKQMTISCVPATNTK